jgi:sec-independent protein translocase protein TatC
VTDEPSPITDHLAELRNRISWVLAAMAIASIAAFSYKEQIFGFLLVPATSALGLDAKLQAIAPTEIFFTYIKCSLLAGFVISLPVTFWQIWSFVAPGLYQNEKKAVVPFVASSTLLFVGGAVFGYTQVFPLVFQFFSSFTSDFVEAAWTMKEVVTLTTRLFLAFGVAFELPLFVFFLSLVGIVSARQLLSGTPYAVLMIFVTAAILTPPDVVSQVFLAVPMIVLYLIGVAVAWVFEPGRRKRASEPDDVAH